MTPASDLVLLAQLDPQRGLVQVHPSGGAYFMFHGLLDRPQKVEDHGDPPDHGGLGDVQSVSPALDLVTDPVEREMIYPLRDHDPKDQVQSGQPLVDERLGDGDDLDALLGTGWTGILGTLGAQHPKLGAGQVQLLGELRADSFHGKSAAGAELLAFGKVQNTDFARQVLGNGSATVP